MFFSDELFFVPDVEHFDGGMTLKCLCKALWYCRQFDKSTARNIFTFIILNYIDSSIEFMEEEYDWNAAEVNFAFQCENHFIDELLEKMLKLATMHVTHRNKKERFMRTTIEDARLAALFVLLIDAPQSLENYMEKRFSKEYGKQLPKLK